MIVTINGHKYWIDDVDNPKCFIHLGKVRTSRSRQF